MNANDIQYLREREVHRLFELMVKSLLKSKPSDPRKFLLSLLNTNTDDKEDPQQNQFLNETVKSITSTRSSRAPTPGFLHKKLQKRVHLRDSIDLMEITDVSERIKRGDFWFEGEIDQMKSQLPETYECHICSTEPNLCETSLYSLYSEENGAWHIVCDKAACLEHVKPGWEYCYSMGDTLNRCDMYTVQLIMSFVSREERAKLAAVAMIWRQAFWADLKFTKNTIPSMLKALSAPSFTVLTSTVIVQDVPSLESTYLDMLISKLSTSAHLNCVILVNCDVTISGYERLVTLGLQTSIQNLTSLLIGPIPFTQESDKHKQSLMRLLSFLCTGIGIVTLTIRSPCQPLVDFLSQLSPEGVRVEYD